MESKNKIKSHKQQIKHKKSQLKEINSSEIDKFMSFKPNLPLFYFLGCFIYKYKFHTTFEELLRSDLFNPNNE